MATTSLLESCRVRPPADMAADVSVPLSQFDIGWVHAQSMVRFVLFYDHPSCSEPFFLTTLVPKLKASLSLTLKHYPAVAGNLLIYPAANATETTTPDRPVIRYVDGDGVSLTIAESSDEFDELVGNHPRDADPFHQLVAEMPPAVKDDDGSKLAVPLTAIRVTLFPGRGVCFGFSFHHALVDARSIQAFISAWAEINTTISLDNHHDSSPSSLPIFDRSVVKDPHGYAGKIWNVISRQSTPVNSSSLCFPLPTNRVRATYILHKADINKLKCLVLAKKPGATHVSSFVVTTCYVWSCLAKSRAAAGEEAVDGDVLECFVVPVDVRARLDPPLPANYFGNCLGTVGAQLQHEELVGDEGFVIAAAAIAESIKNRADDVDQMLQNALDWMSLGNEGIIKAEEIRGFVVAFSPRFDMASADFGWGKAGKVEVVSIDGEKYAMSLLKSHDSEGGLEVGLSLPKKVMEAFDVQFARGLSFS